MDRKELEMILKEGEGYKGQIYERENNIQR